MAHSFESIRMRHACRAALYHPRTDATQTSCLAQRRQTPTAMLDEHREANRSNWDDRVPAHLASDFYGVEDFIVGTRNLTQAVGFDCAQLGDVRGRSLLHVQCHIGLDTLSWARLGASVTGVDFSERSIEAARDISRRSGVPGRFVLDDVHAAVRRLAGAVTVACLHRGDSDARA